MVISVLRDAIYTGMMISAPILIASLAIGLIISIFQATTQIQEQTLTFVPKLLVIAIVGLLTASWMMSTMVTFTNRIFGIISNIAR